AAFREAEQLASSRNDTERARMANIRAAALKPRLVTVVYKVEQGNDVPGFELRQSGALISKSSWSMGLPVDSGRYDLVASAPDRENWHSSLEVPAKLEGPLVVQVPLLRPLPRKTSTQTSPAAPRFANEQEPTTGNAQRTWGIVVGAVGTAAL